jgi:hypothetical protein
LVKAAVVRCAVLGLGGCGVNAKSGNGGPESAGGGASSAVAAAVKVKFAIGQIDVAPHSVATGCARNA